MAGTLTISTLSDGTNSTSSTNCIQGSAKAWVNFNGTGTVAIRGSYNVSSITDLGTGYYQINFTNAMPDTNYSAVAMAGWHVTSWGICTNGQTAPYSTTSWKVNCLDNAGNTVDNVYISVAIFR